MVSPTKQIETVSYSLLKPLEVLFWLGLDFLYFFKKLDVQTSICNSGLYMNLVNYMLFILMTTWGEVKTTKAAETGFWIVPYHPCNLQIKGQHMCSK